MKSSLLFSLALIVSVRCMAQCSAGFTAAPASQGNNLLQYEFTNTSTYGSGAIHQKQTDIFYGDGTSTTSWPSWNTMYHTYTATGTYTVKLRIKNYDSATNTVYCIDSTTTVLTVSNPACATTVAAAVYGRQAKLTATSTGGSSGMSYLWNFGDGTTATGNPVTHTYTSNNLFNASVTASHSAPASCSFFNGHTLFISDSGISGSLMMNPSLVPYLSAFKVWLIRFNATTNMLTAVDSQTSSLNLTPHFLFAHPAPGSYRVKAAPTGATTGSAGFLPTYGDTSLYWSTAQVISYTGGIDTGHNINMQYGTQTSGPGFISGNVSLGANKGAAAGVANMFIMLRNAAGRVVSTTYTAVSGDYSFSGIPDGTYTVYPEQMNYTTTASASIALTASSRSAGAISFHQDDSKMNIKPTATITAVSGLGSVLSSFHLSPNPAGKFISLSWGSIPENSGFRITDMAGRQIAQGTLDFRKAGTQTISLSDMAPGVYLVRITAGRETMVEKLVVQR